MVSSLYMNNLITSGCQYDLVFSLLFFTRAITSVMDNDCLQLFEKANILVHTHSEAIKRNFLDQNCFFRVIFSPTKHPLATALVKTLTFEQ